VWEAVQLQDPVLAASPVLEIDTYALRSPILAGGDKVERVGIKLMGIDAFTVVAVAPDLMPRLAPEIGERLGFLLPEHVFLNPAALSVLGLRPGQTVRLQAGLGVKEFTVAGSVGISGSPVMVADIAAAQEHFGAIGRLSRIELRLAPGATRAELSTRWQTLPWWPKGARLQGPDDDTQRVSTASRAYRVNLTVLALVALFVGAFLVFSVQALSVAHAPDPV
jgi:putative ABC transport system permease protein